MTYGQSGTPGALFNPKMFIGFENLEKEINEIFGYNTKDSFPPYNVVQIDKDHHVIELAVAGYSRDDINIEIEKSRLVISGSKDKDEDPRKVVYQGISERSFKRVYKLGEYVKVKGADLVDGILSIDIIREVPEEERAKTIKIGNKADRGPPEFLAE